MGKPGKSYNDLEMIEGDIANDNFNEQNDKLLDPRAGNINVELPRIKFNAKDVAKLLNKYVTKVDCTKKCLIELTKLLRYYNRLGVGILPYKPKDLKLKSQVLKKRKNKDLAKMVKEGVKKLEIIDSKIKKNSREVIDNYKSLKKLENLGEIIVEHGKLGKSIWKVRKFDKCDALKENFSLNGSWTVSDEIKNDEDINKTVSVTDIANKTLCVTDDEPPLLVPVGFNVEVSETSNDTPNTQVKSSTPSLKSLTNQSPKDSDSKQRKSPKSKIIDESASKKVNKTELASTITPDNTTKSVKNPNSTNKLTPNNEIKKTIHLQTKSPKNIQQSPSDNLVMSKIQQRSDEIFINSSFNESWTICDDKKSSLSKEKNSKTNILDESIILNKNNTQKLNSPPLIKCIPNVSVNTNINSSLLMYTDNDGSASKKVKGSKGSVETEKCLSSLITPEKNSKSPKSPKSPTPEQRVLRRRTIVIPRKKPEDCTPKRKAKDNSETKTAQKRRNTIGGNEISMISKPEETSLLKLEEISNKVLEKVVSLKS